jgi:acetolactate synthase-1/2/3 large subunit
MFNEKMDRRTFLKGAAAAGVGLPIALSGCGKVLTSTANETVTKTLSATTTATTTIAPPTVTNTVQNTTTAPPVTVTKIAGAAPVVVPGRATVVDAVEGTELMLTAIASRGVKKIFFCGGTDNFHFMEYVAKFKALGRPTPDIVTAVYEQTGLYMQMGYWDWTRQPQLTILHVALGTAAGGAAWDNLMRGETGAVVLAGIVSQTTKNELGYGTRSSIQYQQEVRDQMDLVRNYAKWQYKIERVENSALILHRAYQMAASEPAGIAYMCYPQEVAIAPLAGGLNYDPLDFAPATGSQGDPSALQAAAKLLVQAQNPVILVNKMGRHPEAVAMLVALAEKLACPVVSGDLWQNFPKTHWANSSAALTTRDVVLSIDHDFPWITTDPPKGCTLISMSSDPMMANEPMNGIPCNIPITCNTALALPVLTQLCDQYITTAIQTSIAARKTALTAAKAASDAATAAAIATAKTAFPLSGTWIRECVNQVTDKDTIILYDIGSIGKGDNTQPGHLFQQPGPSLGSSWGRGIGIKMATMDQGLKKVVISSGGDGCTMFSGPTSCLMASKMYNAPTIHIVNNNNMYSAVQGGLAAYGGANSYAGKSGYNGSALKPSPDFAALAKAVHCDGEKVTDPAVLPAALQRAIASVNSGTSYVLDTIIVAQP